MEKCYNLPVMKGRIACAGRRQPKQKTVLVAVELSASSARSALTGILRYVNSGHRWQLKIVSNVDTLTDERVRTAKADGIDGIIAGLPEAAHCFRSLLVSDIPTSITVRPERMPVAPESVRRTVFSDLDNEAIAQAAAEYFASRGNFRSIAFVSYHAELRWSRERERRFCDFWMAKGVKVAKFTCTADDGPMDAEALGDFLRSLPKPAAVWCVYDVTAVSVADVCTRRGIAIPDQIALLGVDNDEVLCRFSTPNLSSVAADHEGLGYHAAEALDRLMSGGKQPSRPFLVAGTPMIVERDSTRRIPPASHLVGNALKFIAANAASGITVRDVVRHLGVSRPLADLRFRQILKKSIGRTINEARVAEIKRRLTHSDSSVAQISVSCAFSSPARMAHFFKRETGMTMGDYRSGGNRQTTGMARR